MLLGITAQMIEKLEKEFQEASPEERELFIKSSLSLLQTILGESKNNMGQA